MPSAGLNVLRRAEMCLANIAARNPRVNAVVSVVPRESLERQINQISEPQAPRRGIAGRIFTIKDNYCTRELETSCASKVLQGFTAPYDSEPVELIKKAGGIIIGKTNMDEFAMGTNNDFSRYGKCLNPLYPDEEISPGGSSGGSAAAVAADMCEVSLGSDTGGSVRLPGAYCGVYGFKPSYGLLSRNGVIAYAQSLDTVGILSKSIDLVEDTFDVLNQYDPNDPTSIDPEYRAQIAALPKRDRSTLTVGVMEEAIIDMDPEVQQAWIDALDALREQGHRIKTVSVPSLKSALPTYFIISPAEASSNLSRYDGIRYGYRAPSDREEPSGFLYAPTRTNAFGAEVQRRILLGTYNLSSGQYGNHFEKAQRVRRKIQLEFDEVFATPNVVTQNEVVGDVDVLINPTARTRALPHGQHKSAIEDYINDVLTVPPNIAGLPAISCPWGQGQDSVGIQVIGQFGDDKTVLHVARLLEALQKH
ncbi:glutamyl-tRNA(Gln) amidotransferase subunit A, mitochondrial [Trichomonascus vanleenenianus]|uniref:glutamyl-tRNA(Gln) amidotransferase subunit HER2 n=1 Tax=Trichomonascus vanleenenianus TaxID=2268995 RepID=UPI003ECB5AD2